MALSDARPHRHSSSPPHRTGGRGSGSLRPLAAAGHLLGATALLAACDGWTWSDEGPRKPADGRPFVLEVIGTRTCTPETDAAQSTLPRLLGVEVEVVGWADAGVPANYYYARLEDEDGRRYAAQEGCEPLLQGPPLRPGERARGFVSFAVPANRKGFNLVYEPRLVRDGGRTEPARFEVSLGNQEGT